MSQQAKGYLHTMQAHGRVLRGNTSNRTSHCTMTTNRRLTFRANGDANNYALLDADTGNWFMSLQANGEQMEAKQVENLRRLAATWYACDGITTETLERVEGDTTPVFELLMQTTKQRDALRTALNNLLNTVNQYDDGDYYLGTDAEQILAEANRVSIETAEPAPEPVFGAFSDGSLSIEHGDTFLRLGEKQAKALQAFMCKAWSRG